MTKETLRKEIYRDLDCSCEECKGYEDCDCDGYNQALVDVLNLLSKEDTL